MNTRKFFWACMLFLATAAVSLSFTACDGNDPKTDPDPDPEPIVDPDAFPMPDSIKNGSNFYCIFLGDEETNALGSKVIVPTMMRDFDIWPAGQTLAAGEALGLNAFGAPEAWTLFTHAAFAEEWNGGAYIAVMDQFETAPDLSAIDGTYTFHFAIKSPTNQTTAGTTLMFYSEGPNVSYYFGPQNEKTPKEPIYGGNYAHDGEWHHFEIPAAELLAKGYLWTGPLKAPAADNPRRYLLGFQGVPHIVGNEINLDALFFYKKP